MQKPFKPYGGVEGGERVVFLFRLMGVWLWMGCVVAGGFPAGWLGGVFWAGGGAGRGVGRLGCGRVWRWLGLCRGWWGVGGVGVVGVWWGSRGGGLWGWGVGV